MTLQRFIERLIWLCMLPLIVLGAVLLTLHVHTHNERRQMLVDSVVRAAARGLDQMLEVRLSSLSLLGQMLGDSLVHRRGALDLAHAHRLAQEYLHLHGHHVLIATEGGEMLVNTRVPFGQVLPRMPVPKGRSAVSIALATNTPAVGDPFIGAVASVPMVALAVPLPVTSQQRLILLTTVETSQLQDRLLAFSLPTGWILSLNDGADTPLFQPSSPQPNSRPVLRGTASLTQAPWTLSLVAPPVSLLDDPWWRTALMISTLAVTILLAYWGARLASRRLIGDMRALIRPGQQAARTPPIEELAQVRWELQRLARAREAAQEAERRRIGLELHDELQQKLALMWHDLTNWQGESAERFRRLVHETIDATRRLVQDLRPPLLVELGLPEALQALAEQHQRAHGQTVDVQVIGDAPWGSLSSETATALYRITQEALNNARKHSQVQHIHISLEGHAGRTGRDAGEVVIEVADDGVGFDPAVGLATSSNGLWGIHERAQALGGHLEVVSSAGEGAALIVHLPWPLNRQADAAQG